MANHPNVVKLDGIPIQWKSQVKHLGNVISHDLCDSHDIKAKKHIFISQVNTLNNKFSSISCTTRGKLFQTYCCAWYGCQTWDLNTKRALHMNIEWNKAVRRTMRIPYDTRSCLLPLIIRSRNFRDQHKSRVTKFLNAFMISENQYVRFIGHRARTSTCGPLGRNWTRCTMSGSLALHLHGANPGCHAIDPRMGPKLTV